MCQDAVDKVAVFAEFFVGNYGLSIRGTTSSPLT